MWVFSQQPMPFPILRIQLFFFFIFTWFRLNADLSEVLSTSHSVFWEQDTILVHNGTVTLSHGKCDVLRFILINFNPPFFLSCADKFHCSSARQVKIQHERIITHYYYFKLYKYRNCFLWLELPFRYSTIFLKFIDMP